MKMGITVLPPDINESYSTFTAVYEPETKAPTHTIRFGLNAIKNVGENVVKAIVHERKANGWYATLTDLLTRVQVKDFNKKSLESLIKAGALDRFGERGQLLGNLEGLLQFNKQASQAANANQHSLFANLPSANVPTLRLKPVEAVSKRQGLQWEKELVGLYLSDHPLREYQDQLNLIATPMSTLAHHKLDERVRIGGIITKVHKILTKRQEAMLFVTVEDSAGSVEVVVFPKILQQNPDLWAEERLIIVEGKVSDKDGEPKILVDTARELDMDALKQYAATQDQRPLLIHLPESLAKEKFIAIQDILARHPGRTPVELITTNGQGTKRIASDYKVDSQAAWSAIADIVGTANVRR